MARNTMKDVWMRKRKEDERMELLKAKKRGDKAGISENGQAQPGPGEEKNVDTEGAGEENL